MSIFKNIWNYNRFEFVNSELFWLFLIIPLLIGFYALRYRKKFDVVSLSTTNFTNVNDSNIFNLFQHFLFGLKLLGIAFFIIALARPQDPNKAEDKKQDLVEGIDIVLALDISGSMESLDYEEGNPRTLEEAETRLDVAKEVAKEFIDSRKNDNIGLVAYGGVAFTMCALTPDHDHLKERVDQLNTNLVTPATAIGEGLKIAGKALHNSKAKSKVIILMTDGENNAGSTHPMDAVKDARSYDMRIYTVGMGSKDGMVRIPQQDIFGNTHITSQPSQFNEELLQDIASNTGGKYFKAEDKSQLSAVYKEIDQLEKTKLKSIEFKIDPPEEFLPFLIIGLTLLLFSFLIQNIFFRSIS